MNESFIDCPKQLALVITSYDDLFSIPFEKMVNNQTVVFKNILERPIMPYTTALSFETKYDAFPYFVCTNVIVDNCDSNFLRKYINFAYFGCLSNLVIISSFGLFVDEIYDHHNCHYKTYILDNYWNPYRAKWVTYDPIELVSLYPDGGVRFISSDKTKILCRGIISEPISFGGCKFQCEP